MATPSISQIVGATAANTAEVEALTKATRVTLRPNDYGALGVYSVGGVSGIMAAGAVINSPIFSFRWSPTTPGTLALVRRVIFSAANDTTAFAVGIAIWHLRKVTGFTVSDSGGTSLLPTGNMNKLRTSGMATTQATDIRMSSTAVLTAGTRTLVGASATHFFPLASAMCGTLATAGTPMVPPTYLVDRRPGEYPLILGWNEGLVLNTGVNSFPATGTWKFAITIQWAEALSYP